MNRDVSNHPGPAVIASGADLTPDQLDALTPEQRERLTSGEPLPIDPRSPMAPDGIRVEPAPVGRSDVAQALDRVEGTGDGDGDGLMDHGTPGSDVRETETGATTDETQQARNDAAAGEPVTVTGRVLDDGDQDAETETDQQLGDGDARDERLVTDEGTPIADQVEQDVDRDRAAEQG